MNSVINGVTALLVLLVAAMLEAGGDALMQLGLHSPLPLRRAAFICLGSVVLMLYGVVVNLPPWNFGRLLGVYVTLFFLVAQLINWFGFGLKPTPPILVGGALIMTGGLVISVWRA